MRSWPSKLASSTKSANWPKRSARTSHRAIVGGDGEGNGKQRERGVEKVLTEVKILKGRTVGLLGLAFKPNTDDLRDAPALDVARELIARGVHVKAHDPVAMERFRKE